MHREWLKRGLQQPGKSNAGLAKVLGCDPSIVSKMVTGKRQIKAIELPVIASYLGVPEPRSVYNDDGPPRPEAHLTTLTVPVTKIASGGVWREVGALAVHDRAMIPSVPNPKLAGLKQYAVRVEGSDTNRIFLEGDYAIFVPFAAVRESPRDGDLVEVERRRGQLKETTIRRVRIIGQEMQLWPESNAPEWQRPDTFKQGKADTEIVGLYVGLFRPNDI
jgi:hypothetical protein